MPRPLGDRYPRRPRSARRDADALRLHNLFLSSVLGRGGSFNVEDGWLLLNSKGFLDAVDVEEPSSMSAALDKLVERYPWLADG